MIQCTPRCSKLRHLLALYEAPDAQQGGDVTGGVAITLFGLGLGLLVVRGARGTELRETTTLRDRANRRAARRRARRRTSTRAVRAVERRGRSEEILMLVLPEHEILKRQPKVPHVARTVAKHAWPNEYGTPIT